jgi:hypothetical protein
MTLAVVHLLGGRLAPLCCPLDPRPAAELTCGRDTTISAKFDQTACLIPELALGRCLVALIWPM